MILRRRSWKNIIPTCPDIRKNYALYEDAVENMDKRIGLALAALKRSGPGE